MYGEDLSLSGLLKAAYAETSAVKERLQQVEESRTYWQRVADSRYGSLVEVTGQRDEARVETATLKERLQLFRSSRDSWIKQSANGAHERDAALTEKAAMEDQLQKAKDTVYYWAGRCGKRSDELNNVMAEKAALEDQLKKAEAARDRLQAQVDSLKNEVRDSKNQAINAAQARDRALRFLNEKLAEGGNRERNWAVRVRDANARADEANSLAKRSGQRLVAFRDDIRQIIDAD